MEQAAASTLTGLFAQLGIAGFILAVLIAGAVWYLKASRDLRDEKRGVIKTQDAKIETLRAEIKERDAKIVALTEALLDCQFPGRVDRQ